MTNKLLFLMFSFLLVAVLKTNSLEWQSSGQLAQGEITFIYDAGGIWNRSGTMIFPSADGDDLNVTGTYYGDGSGLTGLIASSVSNDLWVNETGDTMSGNLDMDGNKLTDVGELIMSGIVTSQNIIPITHNLYTLGNSSHWLSEAYITNLYAVGINASEVNSTDVNSDRIGADNLTIGTNKIIESNGNMVVVLT